jgi:hypothetical protein
VSTTLFWFEPLSTRLTVLLTQGCSPLRPCCNVILNQVETLFHEFGHGLQHMLTTVDHGDAAGSKSIPLPRI